MPSTDTLERFITRVEENAHAEAIEAFYTAFASVQENQQPPRVGRDRLVAHARGVLAQAKSVQSRCIRPVFVKGNHVVLRWEHVYEWLDGTRTQCAQMAWQRWDGERIDEEQLFFDPGPSGGAPVP